MDNHVKNKKYGDFVSISSLTGECAAEKFKNFCSYRLWSCLYHMVILRSQNKITDFFMILAWASPFNLSEKEAILDYTHNAMSKIFSGHTSMPGIPENPIGDTKIMNLLMLYRKLYPFII